MSTSPKRSGLLIAGGAILLLVVAGIFLTKYFHAGKPAGKSHLTARAVPRAVTAAETPAGRIWDVMAGMAYLDLHGSEFPADKTPADYAKSFGASADRLLAKIQAQVSLVPYEGSLAEPFQLLESGAANSLDRARLLRALLSATGIQAQIVSVRQDGKAAFATYASSSHAVLPRVKPEELAALQKEVAELSPAIYSKITGGTNLAAESTGAAVEQRLYWVRYLQAGKWTDLLAGDMTVGAAQRLSAEVLSDAAESKLVWQVKLSVTNILTGDPGGKGKDVLSYSARASDLSAIPITFLNRPDGSLSKFVPTLLAGRNKVEGSGFAWKDSGKELRSQVLKIDVIGPAEARHFARVLVGERGTASEAERGLEIATSAHITILTSIISEMQFERAVAGNLAGAARILFHKPEPGKNPEPLNAAAIPSLAILDVSNRYAGQLGESAKQVLAFQGRPAIALDRDFVQIAGDSLVRSHTFDLIDPGHSLHGTGVPGEILLRAAIEESLTDALLEDWMASGKSITTSRRAVKDLLANSANISSDKPPAGFAADDFGKLHPVYRIGRAAQTGIIAGWRVDPGPQVVSILGDGSGGTQSTNDQMARVQTLCTGLGWGAMLVPAEIVPPTFLLGGIVKYDCELAKAYNKSADVIGNLAAQIGGESPASKTTPDDVGKQIKDMTDGLIKDIVKGSIGSAVGGLALKGVNHVVSGVVDSIVRPLTGAATDFIASKIGGGLENEFLSEAESAACKEAAQLAESLENAGWSSEDAEKFIQNYGCFGRGTLVQTPSGPTPIESVHAGELVMSRNPETGAIEARRVDATSVHNATECLRVTLSNGEQLQVTPNHLFYLPERQAWAPASTLVQGAVLFSPGASPVAIRQTRIQACTTETYDLRVEGDHTFFVSQMGILVHNSGEDCESAKNIVENALEQGKSQDEITKLVEEKLGQAGGHESELQMDSKLAQELDRLRDEVGPKVDDDKITGGTVGVASSDIPGLQGKVYDGKSGSLHEEWPWKDSEFFSEHERSQNHAEEDLANQLDRDLKATGKNPGDIEGVIKIHVDQAVCAGCRSGLDNPAVDLGVLGKFSAKYPNVEIQASNSATGEVIHILGGARTGH